MFHLNPIKAHGKKNLSNLFAVIVLKKKAVLILTILFVSIAVIGITRIKINSHFLDDLNDTSKLKNELKFFEEKFGGIRPFEMNVTCKKDISTTDLHVINQLDSAQSYLEKEYGLSLAISVITLLKETNVTLNSGNFDHYKIPQEQEKYTSLLNFVHTKSLFEKSSYFINGNQFRFSGKIKDLGSKEIRQKNDELLRYLAQFDEYLHFEITGAAHLMDEANNNVSLYLISGLFFSILVVTVIIAITLKSIKFALISILPNILPLILVMGLMGWIGIDLKISTALIFTVLYGIAVDDTIHLLLGYQTERKRKRMDALEFTYTSTGKKIILTSIMICAGFLAFLFSEFTSTVYAGFLLIIGLGITLMADLINLPIILSSLENKHK